MKYSTFLGYVKTHHLAAIRRHEFGFLCTAADSVYNSLTERHPRQAQQYYELRSQLKIEIAAVLRGCGTFESKYLAEWRASGEELPQAYGGQDMRQAFINNCIDAAIKQETKMSEAEKKPRPHPGVVIQDYQDEILKIIQGKNSWGKNELIAELHKAKANTLIKYIE